MVPVPGASIKGVMRAAARDVLGGKGPHQDGGDHPLVVEVFGDEEGHGHRSAGSAAPTGAALDDGSPWHWDDVAMDAPTLRDGQPGSAEPLLRNRIRIDDATGTVASGALLVAEEFEPAKGRFEIWRSGRVPAERVDLHQALLAVCAALVDGVGADRRAGVGWVSLRPTGLSESDWARYAALITGQIGGR
jgi:CRISPR/Cas system CMR subunit Cmr4 (Cas7 group RAMP superfamily)